MEVKPHCSPSLIAVLSQVPCMMPGVGKKQVGRFFLNTSLLKVYQKSN